MPGRRMLPVRCIGEALLWIAAGLTLMTGYDYLRAGLSISCEDDAPAIKAAQAEPRRT